MTDERTREELADALKNYTKSVVASSTTYLINEAAARLREPEGERIEGWATRKGIFKQKLTPNQVCPNVYMWSPAYLVILRDPEEPEK